MVLDRLFVLNPYVDPVFPDPRKLTPIDEEGLVAIGGVLEPPVILEAYRKGIFPWTGEHPIPWYSPDPRMILRPGALKVRRTLEQTMRKGHLSVHVDRDFRAMMRLCATIERPGQDGTWITWNMMSCWLELHRMGHAHSVEIYDADELVGGLYGLALGRAFFGESMASSVPDASKVALVHLCRRLERWGYDFIDCQQSTRHLAFMGAEEIARENYLRAVEAATAAEDRWGAEGEGAPGQRPDDEAWG